MQLADAAVHGGLQARASSALFEKVSGKGFYPDAGTASLRFVEFTAVHPIGSFNDYTDFRGKKIPLYPTPGRRALTTHQRTHTVDHIPTKLAYSYFPWIPYMHVGKALHNSFHTLWWPLPADASSTPDFLTAEWRQRRPRQPRRQRATTTCGCSHGGPCRAAAPI